MAVAVYHVVVHREAQEIWFLVVLELDNHRPGNAAHGGVVHRRLTGHHCVSIDVQLLRVSRNPKPLSTALKMDIHNITQPRHLIIEKMKFQIGILAADDKRFQGACAVHVNHSSSEDFVHYMFLL